MLTYNRANYISLAIESALAQTYKNFELIILDDGSTDNTTDIVAAYTDTRLRYIRDTTNKGLYTRRHESLSYVTGTYVAILDSDDIWSDDGKLKRQVAYLEENSTCAVVGTFITTINEHGQVTGNNDYYTSDADIRGNILLRNQFANSSTLMRQSALQKTAGYRDFAPCEDFELFLQLGQFGTFANLSEYSLQYRIHSGSISKQKMKVAKRVIAAIKLHQSEYPNATKGIMKMRLLYLLAFLRLK